MAETKPELAGVPRANSVALYVPSGRRHYAPRRDPAAKGEAGGHALSQQAEWCSVASTAQRPDSAFRLVALRTLGDPHGKAGFPTKS